MGATGQYPSTSSKSYDDDETFYMETKVSSPHLHSEVHGRRRSSPKYRHSMVSLRPTEVAAVQRSPSLELLYQASADDQTDSVFYDAAPYNAATVLRVTPIDSDQFGKQSHLVETFGTRSLRSWKPVPAPRVRESGYDQQSMDMSTPQSPVSSGSDASSACSHSHTVDSCLSL